MFRYKHTSVPPKLKRYRSAVQYWVRYDSAIVTTAPSGSPATPAVSTTDVSGITYTTTDSHGPKTVHVTPARFREMQVAGELLEVETGDQ